MIWCRNGPTGRYVYHKESRDLSRFTEGHLSMYYIFVMICKENMQFVKIKFMFIKRLPDLLGLFIDVQRHVLSVMY